MKRIKKDKLKKPEVEYYLKKNYGNKELKF